MALTGLSSSAGVMSLTMIAASRSPTEGTTMRAKTVLGFLVQATNCARRLCCVARPEPCSMVVCVLITYGIGRCGNPLRHKPALRRAPSIWEGWVGLCRPITASIAARTGPICEQRGRAHERCPANQEVVPPDQLDPARAVREEHLSSSLGQL